MTDDQFQSEVSAQDNLVGVPMGWIQWKGTNVCIDLHCDCGHMGHVDGDFFYFYQCKCGKKYTVGQNIKLIPLTPEQAEHVERRTMGFTTETEDGPS